MARISRIVLVSGRLEASSVATYTEHLARGLLRSGAAVRSVSPGGPSEGRLREAGIELDLHPFLGRPLVDYFAATSAAARMLRFTPEIIHAQSPEAWRSARRIGRATGVPVVVTAHEFVSRPSDLPWHAGEWPVTLALSEPLRENLVNDGGMPKTCVVVTPVGLDLGVYARSARVAEEGAGETAASAAPASEGTSTVPEPGRRVATVGCVARLDERHGVEYFIRAAKLVQEKTKDVEFFVLGTGPLEARLRALAKDLTVRGRVTFLGDGVGAEQFLPSLDLLVLPALREALGIEALQAMACAKPVVATGVGGVFRVVRDGRNGFVVPPADEKALAAKVLALVADGELRRDLGRAGREIVEREFRLDDMVHAAEEVYERARRD